MMPGVGVKNEIITKGWTLGEVVEETRGKLHLKGGFLFCFRFFSVMKNTKKKKKMERIQNYTSYGEILFLRFYDEETVLNKIYCQFTLQLKL